MSPTAFRPPSVPLVTVDPYFSIWSPSNRLNHISTKHWTGKRHSMFGLITIDGQKYRFMGGQDNPNRTSDDLSSVIEQTSLTVTPLSSTYTFETAGVQLTVRFTTPLLLDDLDVLSRPASYIDMKMRATDGRSHQIELYLDIAGELAVDSLYQEVEASRGLLPDGSSILRVGSTTQAVLGQVGDDQRIDWGYAYLVVPQVMQAELVIMDIEARNRYTKDGCFPSEDDVRFPMNLKSNTPLLACRIPCGTLDATEVSRRVIVAYDDILSVEYFGQRLPGYWKRGGRTFEEMLLAAISEGDTLLARCDSFDATLIERATLAGGKEYADLCALAYRQAIAAHKLVEDKEGNLLFFSKENFSNGCMGTVDVSYPSIPLFLLYNSELVKGMLRPIFKYAAMDEWPYEFAPHDVGIYPLANGQVYGLALERQMPIEECGNMLIMAAAISVKEDNVDYASSEWELLTQWANYLLEYGMDPGNQLCTDDFAGHLAHNANLSIKAIVGIGAYGLMARMRGDQAVSDRYLQEARSMAGAWEKQARNGEYYRLSFDAENSWSLKYNLVWDELLGLKLFDPVIRSREVAHYLAIQNRYGVPLDSRMTYTKADWLVWSATLADKQEDFEALIHPLWLFLHESVSRVAFTDWYYTIDGRLTSFINRSVVGGVFIKLLSFEHIDAG